MSIDPPRRESTRSLPGIVVPLAVASLVLIALILVFGSLAFGGFRFRQDDPAPTSADPATALEVTEFVLRDLTQRDGVSLGTAEISFRNTADLPIEPRFQVYAQCNDNESLISNITTVPTGLDAHATSTVVFELKGSGEPQCTDPQVSFSRERAD